MDTEGSRPPFLQANILSIACGGADNCHILDRSLCHVSCRSGRLCPRLCSVAPLLAGWGTVVVCPLASCLVSLTNIVNLLSWWQIAVRLSASCTSGIRIPFLPLQFPSPFSVVYIAVFPLPCPSTAPKQPMRLMTGTGLETLGQTRSCVFISIWT